jgi:D-amino-acid dehydrogenase
LKTLVLGAGVVGVSTAYFLARAGHQVTVIDRRPYAGQETSFANGGQLSASQSIPWANPHTFGLLLKWLGRDDAPLVFNPWKAERPLWGWGLSFLRNCTPGRSRLNGERNLRLALHTRRMMASIMADTGIAFDYNPRGILQVFRSKREFDSAKRFADWYSQRGCRVEAKSADECLTIEPALERARGEICGGLFSPDDACGDAQLFTMELAEVCARMGVRFHYDTSIIRLSVMNDKISGVMTNRGMFTANAYIAALGSYSTTMLAPLGIKLPIYPAKGYSVTLPVAAVERAPAMSITDEANKLVYSRLGNRLRIAGMAEFIGYDATVNQARAETVLKTALDLFPDCGDVHAAKFWAGLRPLTPDGVPIISRTPFKSLFLNTGHGTLGWTLAAGSGRAIADLVSGVASEGVAIEDYSLSRFG